MALGTLCLLCLGGVLFEKRPGRIGFRNQVTKGRAALGRIAVDLGLLMPKSGDSPDFGSPLRLFQQPQGFFISWPDRTDSRRLCPPINYRIFGDLTKYLGGHKLIA
jgi:hypothetical protein